MSGSLHQVILPSNNTRCMLYHYLVALSYVKNDALEQKQAKEDLYLEKQKAIQKVGRLLSLLAQLVQ